PPPASIRRSSGPEDPRANPVSPSSRLPFVSLLHAPDSTAPHPLRSVRPRQVAATPRPPTPALLRRRRTGWPATLPIRTLRRGHPGHPNPEAVRLKEGDLAPHFTLPPDDGSEVALSELRGRKVVLYFYPKDDTPGCTRQACDLRDLWAEFERTGALVFGISPH